MTAFWNLLAGLIIGSLLGGMYVTDRITGSPWTPRTAKFARVTPPQPDPVPVPPPLTKQQVAEQTGLPGVVVHVCPGCERERCATCGELMPQEVR